MFVWGVQVLSNNVEMKQQVDLSLNMVSAMRKGALESCWPLVGTSGTRMRSLAEGLDVTMVSPGTDVINFREPCMHFYCVARGSVILHYQQKADCTGIKPKAASLVRHIYIYLSCHTLY